MVIILYIIRILLRNILIGRAYTYTHVGVHTCIYTHVCARYNSITYTRTRTYNIFATNTINSYTRSNINLNNTNDMNETIKLKTGGATVITIR